MDAIVADLDTRRMPFHVAVENWQHDLNIGTVVRNANAFLAAAVHIVGERRWNRRGAMVTDRYQHVMHHATVDDLAAWAADAGLPVIGIDLLPGSRPLPEADLPGVACCCSARRVRGCPRRPASAAPWCCTSRSSARRVRSTRGSPAASRCTNGAADMRRRVPPNGPSMLKNE